MAAEFAVITVVLTTKSSLRRSSQLGWLEELLPLALIAPEPPFSVTISRFERPRQILNLYQLSNDRSGGILATISEQLCT
jgi:hypothetical protein